MNTGNISGNACTPPEDSLGEQSIPKNSTNQTDTLHQFERINQLQYNVFMSRSIAEGELKGTNGNASHVQSGDTPMVMIDGQKALVHRDSSKHSADVASAEHGLSTTSDPLMQSRVSPCPVRLNHHKPANGKTVPACSCVEALLGGVLHDILHVTLSYQGPPKLAAHRAQCASIPSPRYLVGGPMSKSSLPPSAFSMSPGHAASSTTSTCRGSNPVSGSLSSFPKTFGLKKKSEWADKCFEGPQRTECVSARDGYQPSAVVTPFLLPIKSAVDLSSVQGETTRMTKSCCGSPSRKEVRYVKLPTGSPMLIGRKLDQKNYIHGQAVSGKPPMKNWIMPPASSSTDIVTEKNIIGNNNDAADTRGMRCAPLLNVGRSSDGFLATDAAQRKGIKKKNHLSSAAGWPPKPLKSTESSNPQYVVAPIDCVFERNRQQRQNARVCSVQELFVQRMVGQLHSDSGKENDI